MCGTKWLGASLRVILLVQQGILGQQQGNLEATQDVVIRNLQQQQQAQQDQAKRGRKTKRQLKAAQERIDAVIVGANDRFQEIDDKVDAGQEATSRLHSEQLATNQRNEMDRRAAFQAATAAQQVSDFHELRLFANETHGEVLQGKVLGQEQEIRNVHDQLKGVNTSTAEAFGQAGKVSEAMESRLREVEQRAQHSATFEAEQRAAEAARAVAAVDAAERKYDAGRLAAGVRAVFGVAGSATSTQVMGARALLKRSATGGAEDTESGRAIRHQSGGASDESDEE